jgi:hypothetical protein
MTVTERLLIPTTGGVEAWKETVKFLLQTLKVQDGNIRTRWGPWSEDENILEFLVGASLLPFQPCSKLKKKKKKQRLGRYRISIQVPSLACL